MSRPKPMLRVAGRPVMQYIIDDLRTLGGIDEVIYITGHLKERVEAYARDALPVRSVFIEQPVQDGTAGAVALARPHVDRPILIVFVDTIFDADLSVIRTVDADGIIWTKEVEDYKRFGVVVTDAAGFMTRIIEKPTTPVSKHANIGLYYIRNWRLLFEGIDHVLRAPPNQGEYYLTDAFQYMIDHGARIKVIDVAAWYDAGKLDTLIATNRAMLERGYARRPTRTRAVDDRGPGICGRRCPHRRLHDRTECFDRARYRRRGVHDPRLHHRIARHDHPLRTDGLIDR